MTFFVLLITARCHIAVCYTRGRAMLLLTKIWDPQLGNPRGTLLKQADQNRTGPYWEEMWTISGNPHGLHMKQMDKTHIGPIWVAHMGPI